MSFKEAYKVLPEKDLMTLRKNPQYLSPKQMDSLKKSIQRDGFLAPIVVRPIKNGKYEVVSGNHRLMAARELKIKEIACVISEMSDMDSKRIAMNLNTIHGDSPVELLVPFLVDLPKEILQEIHLEKDMIEEILIFEKELGEKLKKMEMPDSLSRKSPQSSLLTCECSKCGKTHFANVSKFSK